ncbi:isoprenyl transferase [Neisseria zalophi]|uniref:Isoprenyl transferase n=1 Tax=Neisseria zalophi TaxID=640030 RepID=A0A5J6PX15_9NEIS|nr:isoprenyl transferase [Neisseria zalophi]QEY25432.1 isoprenyl transferase [Neisseria zalophi]
MTSSTQTILEYTRIPRHIAVIMDGNGRWAKKRFLPRVIGHKRGLDALENMVRNCAELGVQYLTVFAFSTENWRRPEDEVSFLMGLFAQALQKQVYRLHENNMRVKVIGNRSRFNEVIYRGIEEAEALTAGNTGLTLTIAVDYGGRWDILQAVNSLIKQGETEINEEMLAGSLMSSYAPEPDLFIRTGGETRISNFLLWQMAYAELYFTDTLWPDFDKDALNTAIESFQMRERRFGRTSEQLPVEQQRDGASC